MSEARKPSTLKRGHPKRSHPGRGGVKVTPERKKMVEVLVAAHMGPLSIARVIGISHTTLRKHFREQLDKGFARRNAEIIMAQFEAAAKGNVAAQKEWLKRSEKVPHLSDYVPEKAPRVMKEPKLGKKAKALIAAHSPDKTTSMGERMARRMETIKMH